MVGWYNEVHLIISRYGTTDVDNILSTYYNDAASV